MNPLVSIIVPVYNTREYLERCVRSICAQTYRKIEILLVDDGSTDASGSLCEKLALEDGRIRVFHKENGGSSAARNFGMKLARGEYFGFVDSDDYIEPRMYELLLRAAAAYEVKIAQAGRDEIDEEGNVLPGFCVPPEEPVRAEGGDFLRELLLHRGDCSFCTKLVHRSLFAEEKFPEGVLNEDFHLLVKMLSRGERVACLPQTGYHVVLRMGSNTRKEGSGSFSRVFADNVDNADMVLTLVQEHFPQMEEEARRFGVVQRLDYLLHVPLEQMTRQNEQYRRIVRGLRRSCWKSLRNPWLTRKNKVYLALFALSPRGIRLIHKKIKRM